MCDSGQPSASGNSREYCYRYSSSDSPPSPSSNLNRHSRSSSSGSDIPPPRYSRALSSSSNSDSGSLSQQILTGAGNDSDSSDGDLEKYFVDFQQRINSRIPNRLPAVPRVPMTMEEAGVEIIYDDEDDPQQDARRPEIFTNPNWTPNLDDPVAQEPAQRGCWESLCASCHNWWIQDPHPQRRVNVNVNPAHRSEVSSAHPVRPSNNWFEVDTDQPLVTRQPARPSSDRPARPVRPPSDDWDEIDIYNDLLPLQPPATTAQQPEENQAFDETSF